MPQVNQQHTKKRKRNEGFKEVDMDQKLGGKFHHDLKEAKRAAKKAKIFETQKLVKKLKQLRLKQCDTALINACELELTQLKALDHETIARTALKSKLSKDKLLSGNEHIQAAVLRELQINILASSSSGPAAKVQSRLLSSKILASEISHIIEGLRAVVIPSGNDDDAADEEPDQPARKVAKADKEDEDVDMGSLSDEDAEDDAQEEAEWESGTVGDDEKEVGGDDEDEVGWESDGDGLIEEDGATDDEGGLPAMPSPAKAKSSTTAASTFLPSLSVGYIKGSDDSDWDDDDDGKAGDINPRKNRRGQRARRAIWEKKFGRNANHKKKEAEAMAQVDSGSRWAGGGRGRGRGQVREPQRAGGFGRGQDSGYAAVRVPPPPPISVAKPETLHPSWEAKKRLQEKQQQMTSAATGASRKIKFT